MTGVGNQEAPVLAHIWAAKISGAGFGYGSPVPWLHAPKQNYRHLLNGIYVYLDISMIDFKKIDVYIHIWYNICIYTYIYIGFSIFIHIPYLSQPFHYGFGIPKAKLRGWTGISWGGGEIGRAESHGACGCQFNCVINRMYIDCYINLVYVCRHVQVIIFTSFYICV